MRRIILIPVAMALALEARFSLLRTTLEQDMLAYTVLLKLPVAHRAPHDRIAPLIYSHYIERNYWFPVHM